MEKGERPIVKASCFLGGSRERLMMDPDNAKLSFPAGVNMATGFHLQLIVLSSEETVVVVQKDVGTENGGYHRDFVRRMNRNTWRTSRPVPIKRDQRTGLYYTPWHERHSNRLDIFVLRPFGHLWLFQAGVVARGPADATTFHLLTELIWQGRVFVDADTGKYVGVPSEPVWGSFVSREGIFKFPDFVEAMKRLHVVRRTVALNEKEPPLGTAPAGYARVDWYMPFGGQRGQGIAKLSTGMPVWVVGNSCLVPSDEDGVVRLRRGTNLRFSDIRKGNKSDSPEYLVNARLA